MKRSLWSTALSYADQSDSEAETLNNISHDDDSSYSPTKPRKQKRLQRGPSTVSETDSTKRSRADSDSGKNLRNCILNCFVNLTRIFLSIILHEYAP